MNNNILITGATGFLGRHLVTLLEKSLPESKLFLLSRQDKIPISGKGEWITCDLSSHASVQSNKSILEKMNVVVFLAAQIPNYSNEKSFGIASNLSSLINLLPTLKEANRIIFASTLDVYGQPTFLPITEEHPTNPLSYYGAGKLASEHFLNIFCNEHKILLSVLRFTQLYGPGEPVIKAIPSFIEAVLNNKQPVLLGDGTEKRDYLFIEDAADAILKALTKNAVGTFNIASGTATRISEVLNEINNISCRDLVAIRKNRIKPSVDIILSIDKAHKELGFTPKISLSEGLRRHIEFEQSRLLSLHNIKKV